MSAGSEPSDWPPTTSASARALRARVNRRIREFFHRREVLEVETPVLSRAGNTDPNIESWRASHADQVRFLRTSPEFPMKRLLAAESGPIYELGRVFRAGEVGQQHNSEFTMLEWYRPGFSMEALIQEVVELVVEILAGEAHEPRVRSIAYRDLVQQALGIDPMEISDEALNELCRRQGWYEGTLDRSACLDLVFSLGVVPGFSRDELTVVRNFPACQCALARLDPGCPDEALRFEVFVGQRELANGYDELYDLDELRRRFEDENRRRQASDLPVMPLDDALLAAVGQGIAPGCGVALGVDRLLMALGGRGDIAEVINFPDSVA